MNPYDPQHPTPPDQFAGRAKLVARIREAFEGAHHYHRGGAVLVHGHRGSGKTSALKKIQALTEAEVPGAVIVEVPLQETLNGDGLLRAISEEAMSYVRRKKGKESSWGKLRERIASVEVSVLGSGVKMDRVHPPSPANPFTLLRETLVALDGAAMLLITIDDAERLTPDAVRVLKAIVEESSPLPILLAVAAGPDLLRRLATHDYSPVARIFSGAIFDMESFSLEETQDALSSPVPSTVFRKAWDEQAVRRVHELSHGYPYLVKCLASAAWHEGKRLSRSDVDVAIPMALETGSAWFERELPEASDGDILAFVRIARSGKSFFRTGELLGLGVNYAYVGRLVKLHVLRKMGMARYELVKAPVVAYFHELRRDLLETKAAV